MELERAKWNEKTEYALGIYRVVTSLLGIWPLENDRVISLLKVFSMIIIQATAIILYAGNWIVHGNCGTITEILDTISIVTTSSIAIFEVILPWIHNKKNLNIMNSAIEDWQNVDDEESCAIMLQYARMGRIVCIVQMVGTCIIIIPLVLLKRPNFSTIEELYEKNITMRNLPIGQNCWITPDISRSLYLIFYLYISLHALVVGVAHLGSQVFRFGLAMHICGQFELLYRSLSSIERDESESIQQSKVVIFAKRHNHLLNLANELDEASNMMIFLELGTNTLHIAVSELMLLRALKAYHAQLISSMMIRIFILYVQIFMSSFIGEKVSDKAEKLQVAIYNCPWYNMPSDIVKDMRFIMMRNNRLFHLTAEIMLLWAPKVHHTQLMLLMIIRMYLLYIQMFRYSFVGEELSSKAEKLQVAIYNCPWYNMPSGIVKDMRFIMMRNSYLFHLTAGKIYYMNFESFRDIVKSVFSYFSILRLMFYDS